MAELESLRARIRRIDDRILRLVSARLQCAAAVGKIKKSRGVPLRDWRVERTVLEHAERAAAEMGLPAALARGLMQMLIAEARAEQERQTYSDYAGSAENILVVGGRGRMGRWFTEFFSNQGHRVSTFDVRADPGQPAAARSLELGLRDTAFALLATPIDAVPDLLDQVRAIGYPGVVFDIASLKSPLRPAVQRAVAAGLAITSIHPLFGPGARTLSDQVICFCDCGDADATRRVRSFFSDTAATLVDLSFDEHDRIMAHVLGLSHLVNILFTSVLRHGGISFDRLNRVGSTTFHSQMTTTATVIQENPDLYYAIQRLNPFTPEVHARLREDLEALTAAVQGDDRRAFAAIMDAGRRWVEARDAAG